MNREKIISEMCMALRDHDKDYNDCQINNLFDRWMSAKNPLIDVLRKHPNWNENLMAVSFDQDIEREVDLSIVYNGIEEIEKFSGTQFKTKVRTQNDLKSEFGMFYNNIPFGFNNEMERHCGEEVTVYNVNNDQVYTHELTSWSWHIEMFENREELKKINNMQSTIHKLLHNINLLDSKITEESKELFNSLNIPAVIGQKTSRVLNAYFKSIGLNAASMGYNDKVSIYNSTYAKIADALNPLTIKRHTLLSVHPVDYLLMSNGNSWKSCHNINDGCYMAGTLGYMGDTTSMIFYTVDGAYCGDRGYAEPKINRNVFCYEGNMLLQSRLYPENTSSLRKQFRDVVQNILAIALNIPNYWVAISSDEDYDDILVTDEDSYHYRDYECDDYRHISILKDAKKNKIHIGSTCYCISCGETIDEAGCLHCDHCENGKHTCNECGYEIDEGDEIVIDGEYYCRDCVSYCDDCEEYVLETFLVHDHRGNERSVCESCRDNRYTECEDCGEYFENLNELSIGNGDDVSVCDDCLDNYSHCEECGYDYHCDDMNGELCNECHDKKEEEDEKLDEAV